MLANSSQPPKDFFAGPTNGLCMHFQAVMGIRSFGDSPIRASSSFDSRYSFHSTKLKLLLLRCERSYEALATMRVLPLLPGALIIRPATDNLCRLYIQLEARKTFGKTSQTGFLNPKHSLGCLRSSRRLSYTGIHTETLSKPASS